MTRPPDDPYLWLEEVEGEAPLAWARARNAETAEVLAGDDMRGLEHRIRDFLDSDPRLPDLRKAGRWYYHFWKDAHHPRGLWRRTSLDEYREDAPAWETVLDLDALAAAEGERWVWRSVDFLQPDCRRCLVILSRGGTDADVVREFDLEAKHFVADGFRMPEAKNNAMWRDADTLFIGADFGPGSMTASGYPRTVRLWRRGTPISAAEPLFEASADDVVVYGWRDLTPGFERDFIVRVATFFTSEWLLWRDGRFIRLDKPDSAQVSVHRELLFIQLRDDWAVGGTTHPAGSLLAADFEAFVAGERCFAVLFAPDARTSLMSYSPTRHHILLNELHDVRNRIVVLTRDGDRWQRALLSGLPRVEMVVADAVDPVEGDDYFATASDNLTPTQLLHGTIGAGPPSILKQVPPAFDASGLAITRHEAVSRDGTRVPYFQVARAGLVHDGSHPTQLTGYGGFATPLLPKYSGSIGMAWLERGGVYVVANIRGGGEFGPRWHAAARGANRPRAYEDFIAVAEDLVRRKVTTPAHLGITGGSNGGLLMGNMLTMRPDLFGAIVCMVPVLDMRRYHTLLAGASWVAEFGNPDDPDEWAYIRTFSPYHNLRDGIRYPPVLFMTSTRDDRVHPGHARKMAARMQEAGHDVLYHESIEGGHAGAADNAQLAHWTALYHAFLWRRLR
jgi:prolyl oligopeptidase